MARKKILVVDDEEDIIVLLEKRLAIEGFEVLKTTRGQEVQEKAKEFGPDVILMDIMMDDMDGAEVVRHLQADQLTRSIPVIFLSGIVITENESESPTVKVGERNYPAVAKPFKSEKLLQAIRKVL